MGLSRYGRIIRVKVWRKAASLYTHKRKVSVASTAASLRITRGSLRWQVVTTCDSQDHFCFPFLEMISCVSMHNNPSHKEKNNNLPATTNGICRRRWDIFSSLNKEITTWRSDRQGNCRVLRRLSRWDFTLNQNSLVKMWMKRRRREERRIPPQYSERCH